MPRKNRNTKSTMQAIPEVVDDEEHDKEIEMYQNKDAIETDNEKVRDESTAQKKQHYREGDNKRRYDREWFNGMLEKFIKLDLILSDKGNKGTIREEVQGEMDRIPATETDDLDPNQTIIKITKMIKTSMQGENKGYVTKLLNLQDEVTSKRIEYLENEHIKLHALVDHMFNFFHEQLNIRTSDQIKHNLLPKQMRDANVRIYDAQEKIDELEKQVKALQADKKSKKPFYKRMLRVDASALPALLDQL